MASSYKSSPSKKVYEDYQNVLGKIVINISKLESIVKTDIMFMIKVESSVGDALFSGMRLGTLLKILPSIAYLLLKNEKDKIELGVILKKLDKLSEDRDYYIHSEWLVDERFDLVVAVKKSIHSKNLKQKVYLPPIEEMNNYANEIKEHTNLLHEFMKKHFWKDWYVIHGSHSKRAT